MAFRRVPIIVAAAALALLLIGCQAVDRTAIRLNEDGSFDFGTCEPIDEVTGGTAEAYSRNGEGGALTFTDLPGSLSEGDVVHLGAPVDEGWDRVSVGIEGESASRNGTTHPVYLDGYFDRADIKVGEWSWARTGIFIGTVPVQGCELDG